MEADNVTDVAPTEDFDFTMKVGDVQLGRGVAGLEREGNGAHRSAARTAERSIRIRCP
jgi:hypothetical protein